MRELPYAKRWAKLTEEEVDDLKKQVCKAHKCPYYKAIGSGGYRPEQKDRFSYLNYCAYSSINKRLRGCSIEECEHWKDDPKEVIKKHENAKNY